MERGHGRLSDAEHVFVAFPEAFSQEVIAIVAELLGHQRLQCGGAKKAGRDLPGALEPGRWSLGRPHVAEADA
eukprot:3707951-Heterocapsa_arctica.AAC.1